MYEKTIWSFLFYYVDLKITLDGIDRLKKKKKTVIVSQFESHGEKKKINHDYEWILIYYISAVTVILYILYLYTFLKVYLVT